MDAEANPVRGAATANGELRLQNLVKRYGGFLAVDGVSLDVRPGEFLSLLGPSGSGKTTILNMIAGFDYPSEGHVWLDGRDISFEHPSRRDIGMVFQKYALFPHMSVLDNVTYPLKVRGMARARRRDEAMRALGIVQLAEQAHKLPSQLSGGQQQRVALARAFVFNPRLLLMDEPLSALDKSLRENLQLELKRLQRMIGATVVFVTHDQNEALTMSDRIAVINRGRLEQVGTPKELYGRPETAFVAGFLGETNRLPVRLARGRVELLDQPVPAANAGEFPEGTEATLFVRPERVTLRPGAAGGVPATVTELVFSGAQYLCVLDAGAGVNLHARFDARAMPELAPGDRVNVLWEGPDAVVFACT